VFYILLSSRKFRFSVKSKPANKSKPAKVLAVVLVLIFGSSMFYNAKAQKSKTVNLREAIQMALDSNLNIRSSAYSVEVQRSLKGASWDIGKTNIDLQYGQFNSYTKDNSFTVSQSFAFPTVYINQNKLAKNNVISSEWQLKTSQLEIATQVKQVYWQLAYLYSKQKLLAYQDSLYSGFSRAAELRSNIGETNRLEMITARSQSMEIKNQLQQLIADKGIANRQWQTLMNTGTALNPADTILRSVDYEPISDNAVLTTNPSLGYFREQIEVSQLEKKLELSRALPDFNIGYFSQTMQGTQEVNGLSRNFGPGDRFNGIQAGIALPLWFAPSSSKVKAAKMREQIANTNAAYYTQSLQGKYQSLLDEYKKYKASVDYYEKQAIPEANLIIEQSTRSYKAGALDYLNYVLSLGRALSIRQSYLDALNNYNQTIVNIEFITGKTF